MRTFALAVIAGVVLGALVPGLVLGSLGGATVALLAAAALCCYWRRGRLLVAGLLAFCYGQASVQAVREQQADLSQPLLVELVVQLESVTATADRRQPVTVKVLADAGARPALRTGARLRLGWFDGPPLTVGEHWQLQVRLRPPLGLKNPGGFDYQRWLLSNRMLATGSIRGGHLLRSAPEHGLQALHRRLSGRLVQQPHGELLLALLLGDRGRLTSAQMAVVTATGTVHLLVVSGLHVSMVAGIAGFAGRWLGRLGVAGARRGDARWFSFSLGALAAAGYVLLAGAPLPALRALLMTLAGGVLLVLGRVRSAPDILLLVLTTLLLANPLIALAPGSWLSFCAVAALLWFWRPRSAIGAMAALFLTQGLLTLVSAVLLTQFGSPVAPAATPANLLAVPVITLVVVPAALLGAGCWMLDLSAADWLFNVASLVLDGLWWWLQLWADVPLWFLQRPEWPGLMALIAGLLLLGRILDRWTLFAVVGALSVLLMSSRLEPGKDAFRVFVFDVGQGSAALVQTQRHTLLFDAGAAYPGGRDIGREVIAPSLAQLGVRSLSAVVISHEDNDHAGGAGAIMANFAVATLWRTQPSVDSQASGRVSELARKLSTPAATADQQVCARGKSWQWDGVKFEFIHPGPRLPIDKVRESANERSCTLRVSNARTAALLTGDTGRESERHMVRAGLVPVNMMLVPHHGSAGSSSQSFVRLLRPQIAIVSAGRFNQYGHPRAQVRKAYEAVGAHFVATSEGGALVWRSDQPRRVVRLAADGRVER